MAYITAEKERERLYRSVNRSSGFVHLFLCERERGSGLHSSKGFSYSLHSHTRIPCIQTGGFHRPRHTVCCDFCLGEPDGEEGFYPGSFRDLQQHAPAEPDFIPRLSGALQQATREEWITERAGRGTEGLLCAFASSEDALGIAAGRLRVQRMLVDGFRMLSDRVVIQRHEAFSEEHS